MRRAALLQKMPFISVWIMMAISMQQVSVSIIIHHTYLFFLHTYIHTYEAGPGHCLLYVIIRKVTYPTSLSYHPSFTRLYHQATLILSSSYTHIPTHHHHSPLLSSTYIHTYLPTYLQRTMAVQTTSELRPFAWTPPVPSSSVVITNPLV